jgi:hypothetical protein
MSLVMGKDPLLFILGSGEKETSRTEEWYDELDCQDEFVQLRRARGHMFSLTVPMKVVDIDIVDAPSIHNSEISIR